MNIREETWTLLSSLTFWKRWTWDSFFFSLAVEFYYFRCRHSDFLNSTIFSTFHIFPIHLSEFVTSLTYMKYKKLFQVSITHRYLSISLSQNIPLSLLIFLRWLYYWIGFQFHGQSFLDLLFLRNTIFISLKIDPYYTQRFLDIYR